MVGGQQSLQGGVRFFHLISPACPAQFVFHPSVLDVVIAIVGHLPLPTHLKAAIVLGVFRGASFPKLGTYILVAVIPTSPFYGSACAFMSSS